MKEREQWGSRMGLILAMAGNALGPGTSAGIPGIFLPLVIVIYYTYICSWTLAFSLFSIFGSYPSPDSISTASSASEYLKPYQAYLYDFIGASGGGTWPSPEPVADVFFLLPRPT